MRSETQQNKMCCKLSVNEYTELDTTTHSGRCLETFHCSSVVSNWDVSNWNPPIRIRLENEIERLDSNLTNQKKESQSQV